MLEAGFGTLDYLKTRILPVGADENTDWDGALTKLGLGVAGRFNAFCNRVLQRVVDQVDEFNASTTAIVLRAYPVEEIETTQIRSFTGALDEFSGGYQLDQRAGMMLFRSAPGDGTERIVVTYTGGFWLNDGDEMPEGSTPLPDEILEAWVMQCQAWAEARNLFGTISLDKERKAQPSALQLMKDVEAILEPYRRFGGE
jgi:hypothetical protein